MKVITEKFEVDGALILLCDYKSAIGGQLNLSLKWDLKRT